MDYIIRKSKVVPAYGGVPNNIIRFRDEWTGVTIWTGYRVFPPSLEKKWTIAQIKFEIYDASVSVFREVFAQMRTKPFREDPRLCDAERALVYERLVALTDCVESLGPVSSKKR